jgi:DNA-binding Lrp family transcriptional regulator
MGDKDRDDQGKYKPEYSDKEFLRAVEKNEPAGTSEVADELGIARQGADYRLRRLEKEGKVSKKKVGNSLAWSLNRS